MKQKTKLVALVAGLLLESCQFNPVRAEQFSFSAWNARGGVSISSTSGEYYSISIPRSSSYRYCSNHHSCGYHYHEYAQVIFTHRYKYTQPQAIYVEIAQSHPQVVYIERQSPPDGYYETGQACHANVVCVNGACYRCN